MKSTINYNSRIYGLDVFRAVAILLVVYTHGKIVAKDLFESLPSIRILDGVELFFVLSGFLIGSILIKNIEKQNGLTIPSLFNFWKRRWFRTLPNYFLILLVNFLLVKYGLINGDITQFNAKFLFFFHNFHEGFYGFFWESWSLSIEEWFYISMPIIILGLLQFLSKKTTFLTTIILLILFPLLYRISISDLQVDSFWWDVNFRKVVLTRLDAIIYGVLAAFIKYYYSSFWKKSRNWVFILGILIIYINLYLPKDVNGFYAKTFSFSVTSLGAMLLLPKADYLKSFKIKWIGKWVTHISIISYSMYLVNLGMVAQFIEKNFPPQTNLEKGIMYLVYWIVTIVISTIIYRFFEKPIMNLRDKF